MGLSHLGWEYHSEERTLPMHLSALGYRTVLVGLQHESSDASTLGYHEVDDLNAEAQYASVVAELAAIRIARLAAAGDPFFLSVGMFEPHRPYPAELYSGVDPQDVVVPPYLPDTAEVREDLAAYAAAVAVADAATGRVLRAIEDAGVAEDTIVVFTTDHGVAFPGAKSTLHDACLEVALIVRVPGAAAGRTDRLVSHVDLVPTLLDLLGRPIPDGVQGVSFADALHGAGGARPREAVFGEKNWHDPQQYDPSRTIRTDRYRLISTWADMPQTPLPGDIASSPSAAALPEAERDRVRPRVELYDLQADPAEQRNLAEEPAFARVLAAHLEELHDWQERTGDPLRHGPIRAPRTMGDIRTPVRGRATETPLAFRTAPIAGADPR